MIDTGTTKSYRGFMRMSKTCKTKCWDTHGEQMARALEDEINYQGLENEVYVEHLVWESSNDIPVLVDRAAAMMPKVIVMAIAGEQPIEEEFKAIRRATDRGITVVAASGNTGGHLSQYPAGYVIPCLISVSTKEYGMKYPSANNGEIYLDRMSGEKGTSFSTARAAAHVLKLHQLYGNQSCQEFKRILVDQFGSTQ